MVVVVVLVCIDGSDGIGAGGSVCGGYGGSSSEMVVVVLVCIDGSDGIGAGGSGCGVMVVVGVRWWW